MSSKPAAAVLWGKLAWHPAVVAWRGLAEDPPDPEHIEVLRQGKKSATYRLVGAGADGAPVIAPRSQMPEALVERTGYEQILPHLPVTSPRYYGFQQDSPPFAWLVLQDVGDQRYPAAHPTHLAPPGPW